MCGEETSISWTSAIQAAAAVAAVFVAIVAVCIADRQNKNQRLQINLALYDKRYKVFSSLVLLINSVMSVTLPASEADTEQFVNEISGHLQTFWRESRERRFLIDDDLNGYIDSVENKIRNYSQEIVSQRYASGPRSAAWLTRAQELQNGLMAELDLVAEKFQGFLGFKNIGR